MNFFKEKMICIYIIFSNFRITKDELKYVIDQYNDLKSKDRNYEIID